MKKRLVFLVLVFVFTICLFPSQQSFAADGDKIRIVNPYTGFDSGIITVRVPKSSEKTSPDATVKPATKHYNFSKYKTPKSTCFSEIGYNLGEEIVFVRFRDSGSAYIYFNVPMDEWHDFYNASSHGSYYNKYIKGKYYCERLYD